MGSIADQRRARLMNAGYLAWERQVARVGGCFAPVRVRGGAHAVDLATGTVTDTFTTTNEPDGTLLLPCGDRRSAVCPACAETYRRDSWYLIAAGLRGGRLAVERPGSRGLVSAGGLPEGLSKHPMVFATLTAPSFGPVHTVRGGGRCRPRRAGGHCEHGEPLGCERAHDEHDSAVGSAICPGCYDYAGAVVWNAIVPALWRRTITYTYRGMARLASGLTDLELTTRTVRRVLRLSFVKVAEWQKRGVIHLHAVFRLDGVEAGDRARVVGPPGWASAELLGDAVAWAAESVSVRVPALDPARPVAVWGDQLDVQPVTEEEAGRRTAYLAKYATKAAGDCLTGLPARRMRSADIAVLRSGRGPATSHVRRLAVTCLELADHPACAELRLRDTAHQVGFRGHFLTKSRGYSSTRRALREGRRRWALDDARRRGGADPWVRAADGDGTAVVGDWAYLGSGYASLGDAEIAAGLAEQWRLAREEIAAGNAVRIR